MTAFISRSCISVWMAIGLLAATCAGCSSSSGHAGVKSGSPTAGSNAHGMTIYHDGYALPPCNIGVAPAPCQRTVSPIELQFATPTDLNHGGGYDVHLSGGSVTVTEFVDSRPLESCPSSDGYACLSDEHHVTDQAGTWEIRY